MEKIHQKSSRTTVGASALAIDKGERQEIGETAPEMIQKYAEELQETLDIHKNVKNYYIVVLRKKEPLFPNVVRQWFIAPRKTRPSPYQMKKEYNQFDIDVWRVKDNDAVHQWTLPSVDVWKTILKNPEHNPEKLIQDMDAFEKRTLR